MGETFNSRATGGRHPLFVVVVWRKLLTVEVLDGLSSRPILFNRSPLEVDTFKTSGLCFGGGLFSIDRSSPKRIAAL